MEALRDDAEEAPLGGHHGPAEVPLPSGATGGPNVTYNALGLRQNHFFGPLVPAGLVRRTSEA